MQLILKQEKTSIHSSSIPLIAIIFPTVFTGVFVYRLIMWSVIGRYFSLMNHALYVLYSRSKMVRPFFLSTWTNFSIYTWTVNEELNLTWFVDRTILFCVIFEFLICTHHFRIAVVRFWHDMGFIWIKSSHKIDH